MTILFNGDVNGSGFLPWAADYVDNQSLAANGTYQYGAQVTNAGIPGFLDLVSDPTGTGQRVIKCTVNQADALTFNSKRTELSQNNTPNPVGDERWYAFSTLIPEGIHPAEDITFWQVHHSPDTSPDETTTALSPTIQCDITTLGGKPYIKVLNVYDATATTTANSFTQRVLCYTPLVRGVWVDWVLHMIFSGTAGTGTTEIYKDRRLLFTETSHINTYNNSAARGGQGQYFRHGIYHWASTWSLPTYIVYHKGVVVGDSASSFAEVTGTTPLETIIGRGGIAL